MTDDLVAFINARLDEEEQAARDASGGTVVGEPGAWRAAPGGDEWEAHDSDDEVELLVALRTGLPRPADVMGGYWGVVVSWEVDGERSRSSDYLPIARFIARHDPARVLADVQAKRALIDIVFAYEATIDGEWGCCHSADEIRDGLCPRAPADQITPLLHLAAVWRDHPSFRQEWAA